MESITLRAEARPRGTKGDLRALRNKGMLPAVVYGKEAGNLLVQCPEKELVSILAGHSTGGTLINLEVADGNKPGKVPYLVMIREVQRDPVKQKLMHVDFYQVSLTEEIQTEIPVHLVGDAPGVKDGGLLQHLLRDVTVSCLPGKLPERLEADISGLGLGDQLTVAGLQVPEGVKVLNDPESIVAHVVAPAVEEEPTSEGEAAEAAPGPGGE